MNFFDSHCHFDFSAFDADRYAVWQKMRAVGIKGLVIPGVEPAQWFKAQSLCRELDDCYFALGIHPWWIEKITTGMAARSDYVQQMSVILEEDQNSADRRCVAVGETGLDKMISTPLAEQLDLFAWHVDRANEFDLPLIIHSVRTHNELIAHLRKHKPVRGGVIHAFNGSYETAMQFIDMGFYLGVGGTISYERAQKTRSTFARVPLESLLLESDAPDMPLCGHQGERNSPAQLPAIAQLLAELRDEDPALIFRTIRENTHRCFGIDA